MNIQYDPTLMEHMVTQKMLRAENEGDLAFSRQYHDLADPIYETQTPEGRSKAFQVVFQKLFAAWRLGALFEEAVAEFPLFEEVELVFFKMTVYTKNAGADLMAKDRAVGPKVVMTQVLAQHCDDDAGMRKFLRHEFMHVSDILDEAFRYEEALVGGVPRENWVLDRYKLLWDIYIDGRLCDRAESPENGAAGHKDDFDRLYAKIPEQHRQTAFDWFSNARDLTHADILELAKDTGYFLQMAGIANVQGLEEDGSYEAANLPGAPCPLCKFPTYHWAEDLFEGLEEQVTKAIEENHPGWTPHDGACPRCIEGYVSLAGSNRMLMHHDAQT